MQACWHVPVITATWVAEEREWLEPRRQSLQWAKITPLHFSLGNTARLSRKKVRKGGREEGKEGRRKGNLQNGRKYLHISDKGLISKIKVYFNSQWETQPLSKPGSSILTLHLSAAGKEVCYERLGCFKDGLPWTRTFSTELVGLPWSPEKINTRFLLYTIHNPNAYQVS